MRPIFAAILCAGTVATAARAEDCKTLKLAASLPITAAGPVFTIPVSLNGVEKHFLFDTGGAFPQVASAVVDELKLPRRESRLKLYSVDGLKSEKYALIDQFKLGNFPPFDYPMQIAPAAGRYDGIFTPVMLRAFDFEMDFAARKINIMSADHCEGHVIYWPAKDLAVVPISVRNNHFTVPVSLDGHDFRAIIDTGAAISFLRLDIAHYVFGLTPDSPGMKAAGHVNGNSAAVFYQYPFKSLSFEGVIVTNPRIGIMDDFASRKAEDAFIGSDPLARNDSVRMSDVIIGMDVLSKLHLYLAQKEGKLYLTEASTPAASAPVQAAAAVLRVFSWRQNSPCIWFRSRPPPFPTSGRWPPPCWRAPSITPMAPHRWRKNWRRCAPRTSNCGWWWKARKKKIAAWRRA
jgi:hypothetical protein